MVRCWICNAEIYWFGDRWMHSLTQDRACCSCPHGLCSYSNCEAMPKPEKR